MMKLKRETWYYVYTDGDDLFISKDAPKRENSFWWHPIKPFRMVGSPFYVPEKKFNNNS